MSDQDIVDAARSLKVAHIRADVLGGEHQAAAAHAFDRLLDAVGPVDEPQEVTDYRAEVAAAQASTDAAQTAQSGSPEGQAPA